MKRVGQIYRETILDSINSGLQQQAIFLISYSALKSNQLSEIRKKLSESKASVYVSKNSLAKIALNTINQQNLADRVCDQTMFVWTDNDSVAIAKELIEIEKQFDTVVVQGAVLDNRLLDKATIKHLSDLPSKEVLQATLLSTIQAPMTRLAQALNSKSQDLLSILKQLSEKNGGNEDV
jgi:large subunit ribosomal protein L10